MDTGDDLPSPSPSLKPWRKKHPMKRQNHLNSKLKKADVEIKNYVLELEKENLKLQSRLAKLEVKDISQQHQISELKKLKPKVIVNINGSPFDPAKVNKSKKHENK
jgi:hypothetical protein